MILEGGAGPVTSSLESEPVCPICEGAVRRTSCVGPYPLERCSRCFLEFLFPQPDDASLTDIYGDMYFLHGGSKDAEERMSRMKRATGAMYLDALSSFCRGPGTRLLEIGCGHGDTLVEAQTRGFEVSGVDFSPYAAAAANERLDRQAVCVGSIETVNFPPQHFDAVIFADVLEHVRDPKTFLQRVGHILRPSGVALLITPSLNSFSRRILGKKWMEYKPEHLFYFSPRSIRLLLEGCDFQILSMQASRKILTLDYIWRHFQRFKVPVVSPAIGGLCRLAPDSLAYRHIRIRASGLMAVARKTQPERSRQPRR